MIDQQQAMDVVRLALEHGASDAECTIAEGDEFSVTVRMRAIETVKDAGSRGAGLRVLVGQKVGSAYTSDLSSDGLNKLVKQAMEIIAITTEDPYAGMPDAAD